MIIRALFKYAMIHFRDKETKPIDIHMHYIRQLVHDDTIVLLFCASLEQVANIFTKVFCDNTFSNIKSLVGIVDHAVKHD